MLHLPPPATPWSRTGPDWRVAAAEPQLRLLMADFFLAGAAACARVVQKQLRGCAAAVLYRQLRCACAGGQE